MAPPATRSSACRMSGLVRIHMASIAKTPACAAAPNTSRAPAAVSVRGFSTSTGLPAATAARACSRWNGCVVAT